MNPRSALAAGLALLLPACITVHDATVWNLREMHNPDGSFRRVGARVGDWEYLLRFRLLAFTEQSSRYRNPSQKPLSDPAGESFAKVRDLACGDPDDPHVRRDRLEWYAFLGIDSPWKLVRERCVLELGGLGRRMDLELELRPDVEPAGPAAVGDALRTIVDGAEDVLAGRADGAAVLDDGCARLEALHLTRRGALSAHRGVSALTAGLDEDDARFARVFEAGRHVEEVLLRRALEDALGDEDPRVIAAAIVANHRTYGPPVLVPILVQMVGGEVEYEDVVLEAVLRLLRDGGAPDPSTGPMAGILEGDPELFGFQLTDALVETGTRHPSGSVRLLAHQALRTVTGRDAGPREEDWYPWWQERRRKILEQREKALEAQSLDALQQELERLRQGGELDGAEER